MHSRSMLALVLFLLTFAATSVLADGGAPMSPQPPRDPRNDAVLSYNDGVRQRDRAWKLEKELAAVQDPAQKSKLEGKIRKTYQAAVRAQRNAVQNNSSFFQGWSELGYALRKTGDHTAALAAYDKALLLQPNYAEAIEYRAEAYLGLNRINEARDAYLLLYNGGDAARAKVLAEAMAKWLEQRRADPAGLPAETIDELATWLAQRKEISSHTAASGGTGSWR